MVVYTYKGPRAAPPPPASPRRPGGAWYFLVVLLTFGMLSAVPFAHAAARLQRKDLLVRTAVYAVAAVVIGTLSSLAPKDAAGHTTGTLGGLLEGASILLAVATAATACYQLVPLRREVFGLTTGPAAHPAVGDPVVAARLAARARRDEARALARKDPVLARDLRIGRPALPGEYDDGGLVDLNHADAEEITRACTVEPALAERIVAARQELGSFGSLDEVFVFARIEDGTAALIREYAVLLPR
ncbi:ComEA family DNA-binding protein [Kitasatospora sp. NPDC101183]|uniref:ComEA family DNA-binding protein n=1 Tax=Kitasatospora sp. NPDC101183 TaxID=3364100 RepID=UPI00382ABA8B